MNRYVNAALAVPLLLMGLSACTVAPARVSLATPTHGQWRFHDGYWRPA